MASNVSLLSEYARDLSNGLLNPKAGVDEIFKNFNLEEELKLKQLELFGKGKVVQVKELIKDLVKDLTKDLIRELVRELI